MDILNICQGRVEDDTSLLLYCLVKMNMCRLQPLVLAGCQGFQNNYCAEVDVSGHRGNTSTHALEKWMGQMYIE